MDVEIFSVPVFALYEVVMDVNPPRLRCCERVVESDRVPADVSENLDGLFHQAPSIVLGKTQA